MAVILLYLPIYAVVWLHSLLTKPSHVHWSATASCDRHRQAGTIGVCLILGIAALWYGSILVVSSLPRTPAQPVSVALESIETQHAQQRIEQLRERYHLQALP